MNPTIKDYTLRLHVRDSGREDGETNLPATARSLLGFRSRRPVAAQQRQLRALCMETLQRKFPAVHRLHSISGFFFWRYLQACGRASVLGYVSVGAWSRSSHVLPGAESAMRFC